jgi:hypothetical protein
MPNEKLRRASVAFSGALIVLVARPLMAVQPPMPDSVPDPPYAIVSYNNAQSVVSPCTDQVFRRVGVQPGQIVQVTVHYPPNQALEIVNLDPLDGGMVLPSIPQTDQSTTVGSFPILLQPISSLIISVDGTLSFTFIAANNPGLNQISLRTGSQELGLQFWVLDPDNPLNNPPTITADTPD